ncbi:hypothetical protein BKA81DRAFT_182418 [Phyllosticta paracitricarpa]
MNPFHALACKRHHVQPALSSALRIHTSAHATSSVIRAFPQNPWSKQAFILPTIIITIPHRCSLPCHHPHLTTIVVCSGSGIHLCTSLPLAPANHSNSRCPCAPVLFRTSVLSPLSLFRLFNFFFFFFFGGGFLLHRSADIVIYPRHHALNIVSRTYARDFPRPQNFSLFPLLLRRPSSCGATEKGRSGVMRFELMVIAHVATR